MAGPNPTRHGREESHIALSELLTAVACEADDLALASDALQASIGRLMAAGDTAPDSAGIRALQDVDRISQTLRSLSALLAYLAGTVDEAHIASRSAREAVGLESVARRILGQQRPDLTS